VTLIRFCLVLEIWKPFGSDKLKLREVEMFGCILHPGRTPVRIRFIAFSVEEEWISMQLTLNVFFKDDTKRHQTERARIRFSFHVFHHENKF
jgi:hypothetical protein